MKRKWKIGSELFAIGSLGYSALEILWRGFTHWTMAVTGGVCFTAVYYLSGKYCKKPMWKKCLIGSTVITAVEFVVGCVVNLLLKWNVWDYSRMRGNILGQICLLYSVLWFLLSFPLCLLSDRLRRTFAKQ